MNAFEHSAVPMPALEPLTSGSPAFLEALAIYTECWSLPAEGSRAFFDRYAALPGFAGWLARVNGQPTGMIFGADFVAGNWWCDRVASRLGSGHPAFAEAWVLVELAVRAGARRTGIGGRLHDRACSATTRPRLVLSTASDNVAAQTFYVRRGWRTLGEMTFSPGAAPHLILARERGAAA